MVLPPWSIVNWYSEWHDKFPDELMGAGGVGTMVAAAGMLAMAITKIVTSNSSKANQYLHGSARWADKKTFKKQGFYPETQIQQVFMLEVGKTKRRVSLSASQRSRARFMLRANAKR